MTSDIANDLCEVVITAPDPEWLRHFTRLLVEARLASNAHNFSPVHSIYRWEGEVRERTEGRASLHTRRSLIDRIVQEAERLHPYHLPSVSARPIVDGGRDYLEWIRSATSASEASPKSDVSRP